jgi:flavin reductase (DIM6/NTAB) family NADH-FMN oxidoreductase RutF
VVTTRLHEVAYGITVNAFTAVSLRPPLVLVCIRRGSRFLQGLAQTKLFAVSVLAEHQMDTAKRFADPMHKDQANEWIGHRISPLGSPLLDGAAAWLDCRLDRVHDGGDHVICLGRVEGLQSVRGRKSLVFDRGEFRRVGVPWADEMDDNGLSWPVP